MPKIPKTFNRTIVELKVQLDAALPEVEFTFNRTIVELKVIICTHVMSIHIF